MSAVTTPRVVHHACGHTHRYVLHMTDEAAAREMARLEHERCPACARMSHTWPHQSRMVDSGLGLQPSGGDDRNDLA